MISTLQKLLNKLKILKTFNKFEKGIKQETKAEEYDRKLKEKFKVWRGKL